jgi:hypothetical protein
VRYRVFDSVVASDWPLPELPPAADSADAAIVIEPSAPFDDRHVTWFHEWREPDEDPWLTAARWPDGGYLLRAPGWADFLIDASASRVRICRTSEAPDETLRHLLLDHVVPLVMGHRGELVLHASGVVIDGGALLFIARSGSGKSTIAAALGARGGRVVADDAVALRHEGQALLAIGAYSGLRLWGPTGKRRIDLETSPGPSADAPVRVAGIYVLDPSPADSIRIDPLAPREAVMALVANSYVLDCGDRDRLEHQLDRVISCNRASSVRRLVFPHDAARLEELCRLLLDDHRRPA